MSKWIKKGDKVVVLAGNEKGRTGNVLRFVDDRVVVQGVNLRKKHVKRKTKVGTTGIIEMEMPLHISNVSLCDEAGKPVKVKVKESSKGGKELYFLEGKKEVVHRKIR
jgi:large subunit ribosomal protein L24